MRLLIPVLLLFACWGLWFFATRHLFFPIVAETLGASVNADVAVKYAAGFATYKTVIAALELLKEDRKSWR